MTVRVVVIGAGGRLGGFACRLLEAEPGFGVVARVGRGDDLAAIAGRHAGAVALEVTVAGRGALHAETCVRAGLPTVVGTSGVTDDEQRALDRLARERATGVLILPNFSRGAALLAALAQQAARLFPDVELIERHRPTKRDAPSGTARRLASELEALTGKPVPIHSLRLPGSDATHELTFGARGESFSIVHEARGLEAYADGILRSLAAVHDVVGARRGWTAL
ncbi:MAG: dihydrodipicolinate reductase C-terminal domain-containing protein [Planctomycetota bacterium]